MTSQINPELTNDLRELVKAAFDEGWEAGERADIWRDDIAMTARIKSSDWRESAARAKLVRLIGEIPE